MTILIGAIVVGCLAGFAVMNYVKGLEDAAYEGAERIEVFVAAADIPAGTDGAGASAVIEVRQVPRDVRPATAITSLDEIAGRVALNPIPANSILVQGMFADPVVAVSSFSQTLPDGLVAVSFNFAEAQGVGRWLAPGDRVNIMVRTKVEAPGGTTADGSAEVVADGAATEPIYAQRARMLYQDVVILSVGQTTMAAPGQSTSEDAAAAAMASGLITFAVPAEAALRLTSVNEADLYLSLVPPSYVPGAVPEIVEVELLPQTPLPGEDPSRLTPYGPGGYDALIAEISGDGEPSDSAFSDDAAGDDAPAGSVTPG
jgi:Flp pilus assembly protein CpaB